MEIWDIAWTACAAAAMAIWLGILALPWQPWRTRERLDVARGDESTADVGNVTVLIPARDEADVIGETLHALGRQGAGLRVIVIDDQSRDGTAEVAARAAPPEITLAVIPGAALAAGWAGKLWALEQGRARVGTDLVLLLDADIALAPGLIPALLAHRQARGAALVSLMAELRMTRPWEKLLMPAFVYFFKLLYPFRISNSRSRLVAAAAGGCVLIERRVLEEIGGFGAIRNAIIDDCALARAVKTRGYRTWIGLTHSARSLRDYATLGAIWQMVARTAFTQLRYSPALLLLCTIVMALACWMPLAALIGAPPIAARLAGAVALVAMVASYLPTIRFYGLSAVWALAMPAVGTIYLAMTWSSAARYWRGRRSEWKGRVYGRDLQSHDRSR